METRSTNEHDATAARWDAIGRVAVVAAIPLIAFLALIIKLAWPQFQESAPWLLIFFEICLVVLTAGGIVGLFIHMHRSSKAKLERYKLESLKFAPDMHGNYDAWLDLANKVFLQPSPGNMQQPVPQTYSPHMEIDYHSLKELPAPDEDARSAQYSTPALETVIEELSHNTLEFAYGLDPTTGQLVKTTLPKAVHIQLLGNTGMGKSRQSTSILTQLCTRNDTEHLALALIDCEGETTAPFLAMPHVRYQADEPKEAARALRGLVAELERRDVSRQVWPVLVVFVEEFLNLRRTMLADLRDQALEDYTTLALRGRKRGMFLFSIGQTAYVEKAIRDAQLQFMSSMAFAIQPRAAKSSGFTNTELLNQLYAERKPGQFLLERPAGDAILLAPYVESTAVPGLLADCKVVSNGFPTEELRNQNETTAKPTDPAVEARARQVRELMKKGVQRGDIIAEIWGASSGTPYTRASQELDKIIATLL